MASQKIYFKEYFKDAIQHRYAEKSILSDDNEFISNIFENDVYLDKKVFFNENLYYLKNDFGSFPEELPRYIQTQAFWDVMKKGMPESLSGIRSSTSKKITSLLKKIKKNNIKLCVIGYGGAMSNILFNLSLISEVQMVRPFKEMVIFEPENWSMTNLFRVGKPILNQAFSRFSFTDGTIKKLLTITNEKILVEEEMLLIDDYLDQEKAEELKKEGYIFIGAPDLKTRRMLHEIGADFIMVGHSNNGIRISKNPAINTGAIVETYGTIDIPVLLLNLWIATFNLLDIFANSDVSNIDPDTELFSFNFTEEFDEKKIKSLKNKFKTEILDLLGEDEDEDGDEEEEEERDVIEDFEEIFEGQE